MEKQERSDKSKYGKRYDRHAMETEYVNCFNGTVTTSFLAKKYGVSKRAVDAMCSKRKWVAKRAAAISEASAELRQQAIDTRVAYLKDMAETCVGISSLVRARFAGIHRTYAEAKVALENGNPAPMKKWLARKDVQCLDVAALDKVTRLKTFVEGGPDSRPDMGGAAGAITPGEAEAILLAASKFRKSTAVRKKRGDE